MIDIEVINLYLKYKSCNNRLFIEAKFLSVMDVKLQ